MQIGNREFDFQQRAYVMGILNITPDSFSDGGQFLNPEKALDRALQMEEEGADLIDLGAESTRPGAEPVSGEEEIRRLVPVLKKVAPRVHCPLSVDTRKASVAARALEEGVSLINDISALQDPEMVHLVARLRLPVILMHMKGEPKTMQERVSYDEVMGEILSFFKERILFAERAGIPHDRILVDPGIGFGKRYQDNLEILKRLQEMKTLTCPVVIGVSRKSFIRNRIGNDPKEILLGSLGAALWAVSQGARLVRVHDVKETHAMIRLANQLIFP